MKTLMIAALLLFLVASIYSQTADQAMCITNASTTQAIDLARDCAGANIGDVSIIIMHAIIVMRCILISHIVVKSLQQWGLL